MGYDIERNAENAFIQKFINSIYLPFAALVELQSGVHNVCCLVELQTSNENR